MQVVREMDAGGVADCEPVGIGNSDTSVEVRGRVGAAVVPLLQRNLADAVAGQLNFKAQDAARASYCRKIRKEDAALDFNQSARSLDRRRRAFHPWPGAYFDHGGTRIKVGRLSWQGADVSPAPGTVLAAGEALDVATAEGVLKIHELQRPGGRMLPAREFLKGYRLEVGTVLPSVPGEALLRSNPA